MNKIFTDEEIYRIKCVQDKAFEVMQTTKNSVELQVGFNGVSLWAYPGEYDKDKDYCINDFVCTDFTEADMNRMIAKLNVLGSFNKFSDTKKSTASDDAPEMDVTEE